MRHFAYNTYVLLLISLIVISGCASGSAVRKSSSGKSYTIKGKTYYTMKTVKPGFTQDGVASWYGPGFHGRKTANGEVYDMNTFTAAHNILPLDSIVKVTNLDNGKEVMVRINDRCPFIGERVLDVSYACAQELGMIRPGTAPVRIMVMKDGGSEPKGKIMQAKTGPLPEPANPYYNGKKFRFMALLGY
jgi:rare lipoprotein A